jgi:phage N-6-adenine-methyltransferase
MDDPIFKQLDERFHFTLDAAADDRNTKCELFFTKEQNALEQDWGTHTVWLNPPSTDGNYAGWVNKCVLAAAKGATVVALLRIDINAQWFASFIMGNPHAEMKFIALAPGKEFQCQECGNKLQLAIVIFSPPVASTET